MGGAGVELELVDEGGGGISLALPPLVRGLVWVLLLLLLLLLVMMDELSW